MKTRTFFSGAFLIILLTACNHAENENHQLALLQATTWYQHAAEMKAIYYQTFNMARRELERSVVRPGNKPLAVVLDIDETILDNSPQTARQILDNQEYNKTMWDTWCSLARAAALPGALDFTRFAHDREVEVFYISNRAIHLMDVTMKNMEALGFPSVDTTHILLKRNSSKKESRRDKVRETHEIVLMIGDNLGDFSEIFGERKNGAEVQLVEDNREAFGSTYFLLPNPMYGDWEKPFRGENQAETNRHKLDALESFGNSP